MKLFRSRTLEDFKNHQSLNQQEAQEIKAFEKHYENNGLTQFSIPGFSYPAQQTVDFLVDYLYSVPGKINWRERVSCPITNLNCRLRASIHILDLELAPYPTSKIFISEQVTPLYNYLQPLYANLVGSEFLGFGIKSGTTNAQGVRHEDLTALSFGDNELDFVLSFDCFEHFPDFTKAFKECSRVLKPKGKMLLSVPFVSSQQNNIIRATVAEGKIIHHLPEEYHGDPINEKGCLCFTHFAWEMLDQVRASGFSDCYALSFSSKIFGYLGGEQILFVAVK
jgi:SAM-dependent methyltransferase